MADVKLIIKIPEDLYKKVTLANSSSSFEEDFPIYYAIKNGIVLPKGHGRIADMDEAIKCIEEVNGEDAIWAIALIDWACSKRTLIEADTESEDKDENM